jgi:hypothetical protein
LVALRAAISATGSEGITKLMAKVMALTPIRISSDQAARLAR